MSESKKLIPKRRFKGFEGASHWNIIQLGDIADIIGGGTPSTNIKAFWNGNIDWYSPTEIGEQIYLNNSEKKITQLGLEKSSAKILPIGSILYTSRAGIGNTAILAKEGCTNQGFQSIVPDKNKLNSYFIYSRSKELKKYGEINGAGSTFTEISGKQLAKMPITLPNLKEQTQIGEFFKKLDNLINTQQKKLEKAKTLKSAYLREMFPNEGELKPRLRFTGFNISWKEKKLEEITKTTIGEFVIKTKQNPNSPYPVYNGGISYTGFYDEFNNEANKIVISARGANAGFINIVRNRYWAGNSCYSINIINNTLLSIDYLFYSLKRNQHFFTQNQQAANIPSVSKKEVETFTVLLTNITEQTKIGNFFKLLDDKIALEQKKLDKLKNIKQAYLNEMFV
ncbi:restriction endonuclease subunit S [Gilliamella sp. Occ4-3]|uniref:restriction endonuclease subunit S n=1 Tax=Gilliamella sp. Occ4-3 TaxID=3120254 RepID=UPI00080EAAC2|nr:restriction endonuclease subunit S [Gilliamella apicola]OCG78937.1 hypothetical protein A9G44_12830 [Gilliamella apicola]